MLTGILTSIYYNDCMLTETFALFGNFIDEHLSADYVSVGCKGHVEVLVRVVLGEVVDEEVAPLGPLLLGGLDWGLHTSIHTGVVRIL